MSEKSFHNNNCLEKTQTKISHEMMKIICQAKMPKNPLNIGSSVRHANHVKRSKVPHLYNSVIKVIIDYLRKALN